MIILFYTIAIFTITLDEVWNMYNPRPNPLKSYYVIQWEEKDFYSKKINNEWILRKYRKTDDENKRIIRENYWKEKNERSKRRN